MYDYYLFILSLLTLTGYQHHAIMQLIRLDLFGGTGKRITLFKGNGFKIKTKLQYISLSIIYLNLIMLKI